MMRVALTGATGFVGGHVLPLLLQSGIHVTALARNPSRLTPAEHLTVIPGDLENTAALDRLCADADVVLHMAGAISATSPAGFGRVNVDGSRRMVEAACRSGMSRFVHVSSLAAREPRLSHYAASKAAAEKAVMEGSGRMPVLILRPGAVYGEGDRATLPLVKALLSRNAILPGTSGGRFSLIHAGDLAKICLAALAADRTGFVEVSDGQVYTWGTVAAAMRKTFGRPDRVVYIPRAVAMAVGSGGDLVSRATRKAAMVSLGKMRELYHEDWSVAGNPWPSVQCRPLTEGFASTVAWYQKNGLLPPLQQLDRSGP